MHVFNVTYEIITDESAEHGDHAAAGFISEGVSLRDAVADLSSDSPYCELSAIEANTCAPYTPRWITFQYSRDWVTGDYESRAIHIPGSVTPSSAMRIARLLGAYTY